MADDITFADLLVGQWELQRDSFVDPTKLDPDARATFITWNHTALVTELTEMLEECGWKPWATDRSINHELAIKELVDAIHFLMNLLLAVSGVEVGRYETDEERAAAEQHVRRLGNHFAELYFEKRKINAQRQADGYTGKDEKCPECHRDRATTAIFSSDLSGDGAPGQVCTCGYMYPDGVS